MQVTGAGGGDLELLPEYTSFSPDGNGRKDEIRFSIKGEVPADLNDWSFSIQKTSGETIWTVRADRRKIREKRMLSNFFFPSKLDLQHIEIPAEISWNGRSENGIIVPEGLYIARLTIVLGAGLTRTLESRPVLVDNTPVKLHLNARNTLILRYIDKDLPEQNLRSVIEQKSSETESIRFTGIIKDFSDRSVYTVNYENELPGEFIWNGLDKSDDPADYGVYRYILIAEDAAGNRTRVSFNDILLRSEKIGPGLKSSHFTFSPDGDGLYDTIKFKIEPIPEQMKYYQNWNDRIDVRGWRFHIYERNRKSEVFALKDRSRFPDSISWNGKDSEGIRVDEGLYYARAVLDTSYGLVDTGYYPFRLDLSNPDVDLHVSETVFSPDGDGEGEKVELKYRLNDISGIEKWKVIIFADPDGVTSLQYEHPFRVYEGDGTSLIGTIIWNGEDDRGRLPYSFERFRFVIEASDYAGNKIRKNIGHLRTEVMIVPEKSGSVNLITSFPDQGYFQSDGNLTGRGEDVLDEFIDRFSRYQTYSIRAEVHSDNIGSESGNILKTEVEARNVADYLRKSGIEPSSVIAVGSGESEPIETQKSDYSRYRDKRIQLRLVQAD